MTDQDSGSYGGQVEEASVVIARREVDSKTAQQLTSSGQKAQDKRLENRENTSFNKALASLAEAEKKDKQSK